jgi:hypothetical protein
MPEAKKKIKMSNCVVVTVSYQPKIKQTQYHGNHIDYSLTQIIFNMTFHIVK